MNVFIIMTTANDSVSSYHLKAFSPSNASDDLNGKNLVYSRLPPMSTLRRSIISSNSNFLQKSLPQSDGLATTINFITNVDSGCLLTVPLKAFSNTNIKLPHDSNNSVQFTSENILTNISVPISKCLLDNNESKVFEKVNSVCDNSLNNKNIHESKHIINNKGQLDISEGDYAVVRNTDVNTPERKKSVDNIPINQKNNFKCDAICDNRTKSAIQLNACTRNEIESNSNCLVEYNKLKFSLPLVMNADQLYDKVTCFKCKSCFFITESLQKIYEHLLQTHNHVINRSDNIIDDKTDRSVSKEHFLCIKCAIVFTSFDCLAFHVRNYHHAAITDSLLNKNQNEACFLNSGTIELDHLYVKTDDSSVTNAELMGRSFIPVNFDLNGNTYSATLAESLSLESDKKLSGASILNNLLQNLNNSSPNSTIIKEILSESHNDQDNNNSQIESFTGTALTKKRGRPRGSRSLGLTVLKKKDPELLNEDILKEKYGSRCDIHGCAIRMKTATNLDYHKSCHDINSFETLSFKCPECQVNTTSWKKMSAHLWRNHGIDMELYSCDQCSYKTVSYSKLINLHKRIHTKERPFLCDNCGKGFKTSKQLRNHRVIHSDKRKSKKVNECQLCQRVFSDRRMMRHHMETVHMKIRRFLCNFCGYSASSQSSLKMHMRQHTGEKPFQCDKCCYRTADHNSLRRHRMKHSGEKKYICPFCSYASIQSSTFKVHLKNKHPGQEEGLMFSCSFCSYKTVNKENMAVHLSEHKQTKEQITCFLEKLNPVNKDTRHHVSIVELNTANQSFLCTPSLHEVSTNTNMSCVCTLPQHSSGLAVSQLKLGDEGQMYTILSGQHMTWLSEVKSSSEIEDVKTSDFILSDTDQLTLQ